MLEIKYIKKWNRIMIVMPSASDGVNLRFLWYLPLFPLKITIVRGNFTITRVNFTIARVNFTIPRSTAFVMRQLWI